MKGGFKKGDVKQHYFSVKEEDTASFFGKKVHPVCATFALAREIEWSTRKFVIDMVDADEEGVGTLLMIHHEAPAKVGEEIKIEAVFEAFKQNELICSYTAFVGRKIVARGKTGQKILKKDKIKKLFY